MKLLLIGNNPNPEFLKYNTQVIAPEDFFNYQKQNDFDCIYTANPLNIINTRIKIPYFFDLVPLKDDTYESFQNFYSKLKGAKAVFTNDIKLNQYAEWLELNPYFINDTIESNPIVRKKYLTPKLNILCFNSPLIKTLIKNKKNNWIFHIIGDNIKGSNIVNHYDFDTAIQTSKAHLFISEERIFPSKGLKAMANNIALMASNPYGNLNHLLFNKVNYIRFGSETGILKKVKEFDKNRYKLEKIALKGYHLIEKYFSLDNIINKIKIISRYV